MNWNSVIGSGRGWTRQWRRGVLACALALGLSPAWADVWGFVDAQGLPHFADHRVDDRYELFYRAAESFDTALDPPPPEPVMGSHALGTLSPRMLEFFESSPTFKALAPHLREASSAHSIDFELLQALITAESAFNPYAVSPKGAVGLMQIMPDTARRYGVDGDKRVALEQKLTDPRTNIRTGSRYLRDLINMFPGQLELAIAAYNAGEGAVQRAGNRIPNYKETQNYVKTVMQLYTVLKPPVPPVARHPHSRVRPGPQIQGGATNRGNLPAADDRPLGVLSGTSPP